MPPPQGLGRRTYSVFPRTYPHIPFRCNALVCSVLYTVIHKLSTWLHGHAPTGAGCIAACPPVRLFCTSCGADCGLFRGRARFPHPFAPCGQRDNPQPRILWITCITLCIQAPKYSACMWITPAFPVDGVQRGVDNLHRTGGNGKRYRDLSPAVIHSPLPVSGTAAGGHGQKAPRGCGRPPSCDKPVPRLFHFSYFQYFSCRFPH